MLKKKFKTYMATKILYFDEYSWKNNKNEKKIVNKHFRNLKLVKISIIYTSDILLPIFFNVLCILYYITKLSIHLLCQFQTY